VVDHDTHHNHSVPPQARRHRIPTASGPEAQDCFGSSSGRLYWQGETDGRVAEAKALNCIDNPLSPFQVYPVQVRRRPLPLPPRIPSARPRPFRVRAYSGRPSREARYAGWRRPERILHARTSPCAHGMHSCSSIPLSPWSTDHGAPRRHKRNATAHGASDWPDMRGRCNYSAHSPPTCARTRARVPPPCPVSRLSSPSRVGPQWRRVCLKVETDRSNDPRMRKEPSRTRCERARVPCRPRRMGAWRRGERQPGRPPGRRPRAAAPFGASQASPLR